MIVAGIINAFLGAVVFASIVLAIITYEDDLDIVERFLLAGLAGSMVLTAPTIWLDHTPFDGWSSNVSRGFLAAWTVKRFVVPVVWKWRGADRQTAQIRQSGLRLVDRMRHKL